MKSLTLILSSLALLCCALTWAVRLLGIDATKVTWKPQKVTEEQAAFARAAVQKACQK